MIDCLAQVWIDLEMTGLDVERDDILQIAVICTGGCWWRGWC